MEWIQFLVRWSRSGSDQGHIRFRLDCHLRELLWYPHPDPIPPCTLGMARSTSSYRRLNALFPSRPYHIAPFSDSIFLFFSLPFFLSPSYPLSPPLSFPTSELWPPPLFFCLLPHQSLFHPLDGFYPPTTTTTSPFLWDKKNYMNSFY